jgi:hypothetical protein
MTLEEFQKKMQEQNSTKEKEVETSDKEFGLKIEIDPLILQKVMHWVDKSNFEVSGLGNIVFDQESNTLKVVSAILLPQKNTGTTTDIEPAAVNKAMFLLRNEPGQLRWWWHSHVNMGVFWSGTDVDTIKKLGGGGWFAATVFNKRREMKSAFCQNEPVRLLLPDIPTSIVVSETLTKCWDEEYEKNVENIQHDFSNKWSPSRFSKEDQEELQEFLRQSHANLASFKKGKEETQEDVSEAEEIKETKEIMIDGQPVQMEMFRDPSKKNLVPVPKKVSQETGLKSLSEEAMDAMDADIISLDELDALEKWEQGKDDDPDLEDFKRRWFQKD